MRAGTEPKARIGIDAPLVRGGDGAPLLVCPSDWFGPPVGRFVLPSAAESGPSCTGVPVLFVGCSGVGRRWYRSGIRRRELASTPYMMDLLGARYERDHARWEGSAGESIGLRLPPAVLAHALHERALSFDLTTRHEVVDPALARHVLALADEIQGGFPNGRLYAEGLSLAVIGWLATHYADRPSGQPRSRSSLSGKQKGRVDTYIDAHLAGDLSVDALAREAGLSPCHFAHAFKTALGESPHSYVMRRRVEHAAAALKTRPARSIADIAIDCGFASQSHFTAVFGRITGTTPARWRSG